MCSKPAIKFFLEKRKCNEKVLYGSSITTFVFILPPQGRLAESSQRTSF
jgi:hypothetical protein